MEELNIIQRLIIWAFPVLTAITLHEVAHGWVALRLGDTTAKAQGRLSLNPLRHIDPVGTVLVPLALFLLSGFVLGWAKPVPVNYHRLHHPKRDMALVALAGPAANMVMALAWALLLLAGAFLWANGLTWLGTPLYYMGQAGILINIILAVLNMLPVAAVGWLACAERSATERFRRIDGADRAIRTCHFVIVAYQRCAELDSRPTGVLVASSNFHYLGVLRGFREYRQTPERSVGYAAHRAHAPGPLPWRVEELG